MQASMREMRLEKITEAEAAFKLAKMRAQDILRSEADPLKHLRDFEHLWIEADYCRELNEFGNLDDEVYVARQTGQPEEEIRAWVIKRIQKLATG